MSSSSSSSSSSPLPTPLLTLKTNLGKIFQVTDFSIATWLTLGASLQLLSQLCLPSRLNYWPALFFVVYRIARVGIDSLRVGTGTGTGTGSFTANLKLGRWTARLPEPDRENDPLALTRTSDDGVVMFMLGARFNHPLGKLAPGVAEAGNALEDMWVEAEKNRAKWSYLGRIAPLVDTSDGQAITTFYISYWKDLKALQAFATSAVHRVGHNGYLQNKFPNLGIMHETYHAPKGSWESIYVNMPPLGLGTAKYVIEEGPHGFKLGDTLKHIPRVSSMYDRMGRKKHD